MRKIFKRSIKLDIDKHREDFIKMSYDLVKITVTFSVFSPIFTKNVEIISIISGLSVSLLFLIIAIIFREGGKK